jgi:hypothetical protein
LWFDVFPAKRFHPGPFSPSYRVLLKMTQSTLPHLLIKDEWPTTDVLQNRHRTITSSGSLFRGGKCVDCGLLSCNWMTRHVRPISVHPSTFGHVVQQNLYRKCPWSEMFLVCWVRVYHSSLLDAMCQRDFTKKDLKVHKHRTEHKLSTQNTSNHNNTNTQKADRPMTSKEHLFLARDIDA